MMNKTILKKIIALGSLASVEQHLISFYLKLKNIDFTSSVILKKALENFEEQPLITSLVQQLNIQQLKELEQYLELLIPVQDRKLNGAFFTPNYVIDFIIETLQPAEQAKCLDPSCGSGAFLIGLATYYQKTFQKSIKQTIQENIYGVDILPYNVERAKILLSILALEQGEIMEDTDFNIRWQDSLRKEWTTVFDVIVGNPPYVKFQDLSDENRQFLTKGWKTIKSGTFNLYFAFFELGFDLLKPNGKLGYITPNNYFTSLAGKNLRNFFTQNQCIYRIVDFSYKKVFDVQTYTAITFLNKQQNNSITYDRIQAAQTPIHFLKNVNGSPNKWEDLNIKKWRLLKSNEQKNIKIIESIGTPLNQLFDMSVGIATLKDKVFFVDAAQADEQYIYKSTEKGDFKIEIEVTKPVYKISDFKTQSDIPTNRRRIIFPYTIQQGKAKAIDEDTFKIRYPNCYQYLLAEKELLASRDKGKSNFKPFYVWGRTQGLTKWGKKILNPTFSQFPRFLIVEEADAFFTNGYGIYYQEKPVPKDLFHQQFNPLQQVENIDVVQKILNSVVMHYYVSKTSVSIAGGYPCYQKNFIEKFTIPPLNAFEIEKIRQMKTTQEIDLFLIEKYGVQIQVPNLVV